MSRWVNASAQDAARGGRGRGLGVFNQLICKSYEMDQLR